MVVRLSGRSMESSTFKAIDTSVMCTPWIKLVKLFNARCAMWRWLYGPGLGGSPEK